MLLPRSSRLVFFYRNVVRASIIEDLLVTVDFKVQRLELSKGDHVVKRCWGFGFYLLFEGCDRCLVLDGKLKELCVQRVELEFKLNVTLLVKYVLSVFPIVFDHSLAVLFSSHDFIR